MSASSYYVYVYIDPRNYEPFYYGKGQGRRLFSHLSKSDNSLKRDPIRQRMRARIRQIRKDGLEPEVKVIAAGLDEDQAYLVESTLLWTSRGLATNAVKGHYADKFRPANSFHKSLPGFDFGNQIQYFNCCECRNRCWKDNIDYGYLGAGQGRAFRVAIQGLHSGDIVCAYLNRSGYVGVGRVMGEAAPARDFRVPRCAKRAKARGKRLIDLDLETAVDEDLDDDDMCEWMVPVRWTKTVPKGGAFWKKNAGLFAHRGTTRASLANQPKTIKFVGESFDLDLEKLADTR